MVQMIGEANHHVGQTVEECDKFDRDLRDWWISFLEDYPSKEPHTSITIRTAPTTKEDISG
jgi:hypothetical protein